MSKNKILYEYIDNINILNKEENYKLIHTKIENKIKKRKNIINTFSMLFTIVIILAISTSLYAKKNWDKEYKEYQNRIIKYTKVFIENIMDNSYRCNLNMDYTYQDDLGIKLNSILITDDKFQVDIDFKLASDDRKDYNAFEFGYVIYDENKNIYDIHEREKYTNYTNYGKKFCKELGLKYKEYTSKEKHISSTRSIDTIFSENENTIVRLDINSINGFPKSKKIYVRIFDIGYSLVNYENDSLNDSLLKVSDSEDFSLYKGEWQFEVDVPEELYNKSSIELKLLENVDGIELEKAILSDTGLIIHIITNNSRMDLTNSMITILDGDGNIYSRSGMSDKKRIELLADATKSDFNKKLYLNLSMPKYNINKKIELVLK